MACDLTSGRLLMCTDAVGGLKRLYLANFDSSKAYQFTESGKEITATPTVTIYRYDLEDGAGGIVATPTKDKVNGTRFYQISGDITIHGLTKEMNAELDLITASKLWIWGEDHNGNVIMYGRESGLDVIGGTIDTGVAKGDLSGYTLSIDGTSRLSPEFMAAFTDFPFDGMVNVTVDPAFPTVV